jgi:hypothetical protein
MNFFAHAVVAAARSQAPRFLLGAMLPDLTGMLGARIAELPDREVQAGVAHHHETDAAFHGAARFGRLCGAAIAELTAAGVARGSARAVGHVGVELLLDGALSHDRAARERYTSALAHAVDSELSALVRLRDRAHEPALRDGISRLRDAPVPEGYREPEFVVARLRHILGRRPRLALRESDLPAVRRWAFATQRVVLAEHEALLAEVRAALAPAQSRHGCELIY